MRFIFITLFSLILFTLCAQENNIIKQISSEVKGIKFDTIQVSKFVKAGENYVVYGLLRREGATLGSGIAKTAGKETIRLRAFAKLVYDKDFNIQQEHLHFIRPQGTTKVISLIDGPSGMLKHPEVIAHPEDILTFRELQKKYPEVYNHSSEDTVEKEERETHYINRMLCGGGGKLKGITVIKHTPKEVKERKGLLATTAHELQEIIPYEKEKINIELDIYTLQSKKDYWKTSRHRFVNARTTGRLYTHQSRVIGSDKSKKYNEYLEQEIVIFDKEGKLLNRIELKFERPKSLIATRSVENEKGELAYVLFLVSEKKRIAKKMGLEPRPKNANAYILDKDGKLVSNANFEITGRVGIQEILPIDGKFLTIGTGFQTFESYLFGKDKLEASHVFRMGSEMYKKLAPSYKVKVLEKRSTNEHTTLLGLYTEKNEMATADPMRPDADKRKYGNYFLFQYNAAGEIMNANHIPRPKLVSEIMPPSIETIKEDDRTMTLLAMHGIQQKDTPWKGLHPTVAVVNKSDLEMRTQSLPSNYKLSSEQAFFAEESRVILLVQNTENKYAFAELKF